MTNWTSGWWSTRPWWSERASTHSLGTRIRLPERSTTWNLGGLSPGFGGDSSSTSFHSRCSVRNHDCPSTMPVVVDRDVHEAVLAVCERGDRGEDECADCQEKADAEGERSREVQGDEEEDPVVHGETHDHGTGNEGDHQ